MSQNRLFSITALLLLGIGSACATDAGKLRPALETQLQVPEIYREHPRLIFSPESLELMKERRPPAPVGG